MRIGINATSLPNFPAGAGRYLCNLIINFARVDSKNEYHIFLKRRDKRHFSSLPENFFLVELPNFSRSTRIGWEVSRPKYYAKKFRLDVWHSPHYIAPIGLRHTASVVTIHDMTFFLFPELYSFPRRSSFQKFIKNAVKRADALITVSKSTEEDLTFIFPQAQSKTTTIYSGVEHRITNSNDLQMSIGSKTNITNGFPYILFVGTLDRRKNIPLLISAFSDLVKDHEFQHHLVIVGQDGNDSQTIRKMILSEKLENRVHLTGYVHDEKLRTLYQSAHLFVCPSFYEGFGFPVLEAMAYGVPALCSDVGATTEIASCPEMCFQLGNKDALKEKMNRILSDECHQENLITKGFSRARNFSWEKTAYETIALYEEVVSQKSPKRIWSTKNKRDLDVHLPTGIRDAILQTLIFSDLFDYPLTLDEIHRDLVGITADCKDIQKILETDLLKNEVQTHDNFYFLKERQNLVTLRKQKKIKAQKLLKKNQSILNRICRFPFVQAVALSGTMAFENVNGKDDIDLLIIVDGRRTWSTYLLLVVLMKLIRKRSVMCLNYFEGYQNPTITNRNFFTAHQIAHLLPISGNGEFDRYWKANQWIYDFLPHARLQEKKDFIASNQKPYRARFFQKILANPFFDPIERLVFKNYSIRIQRIAAKLQSTRICLDPQRIQLFTNDHQNRILSKFNSTLKNESIKQE